MKLSGHPKVTCTEPYVTERLHNIEHHLGFTPGRSSIINEIILLNYDKCINDYIERQHGRFGLKYSRILARVLIPSSVFFSESNILAGNRSVHALRALRFPLRFDVLA